MVRRSAKTQGRIGREGETKEEKERRITQIGKNRGKKTRGNVNA